MRKLILQFSLAIKCWSTVKFSQICSGIHVSIKSINQWNMMYSWHLNTAQWNSCAWQFWLTGDYKLTVCSEWQGPIRLSCYFNFPLAAKVKLRPKERVCNFTHCKSESKKKSLLCAQVTPPPPHPPQKKKKTDWEWEIMMWYLEKHSSTSMVNSWTVNWIKKKSDSYDYMSICL